MSRRKLPPGDGSAFIPGNGWMRVLDWDRFALTLYDRATRRGCRVWLDAAKTAGHPAIHGWFLKRVAKDALPLKPSWRASWKPAARCFPAGPSS